ncbi:MAG TPA: hypothetical protein P5077_12030 [bacterium]|nr:hypothetical protein [bacterium]
MRYEKPALLEEKDLPKELLFACIFQNPKKQGGLCEGACQNAGQSETPWPCV